MRYWLMKSEPDEFSIDDLAAAPKQSTPWFGVRNYQARNFMRDAMRPGDGVLFYHSSCPEPGIAGLAEASSGAAGDCTGRRERTFHVSSPGPGSLGRRGRLAGEAYSRTRSGLRAATASTFGPMPSPTSGTRRAAGG